MKTRSLVTLVGLAISFALPTLENPHGIHHCKVGAQVKSCDERRSALPSERPSYAIQGKTDCETSPLVHVELEEITNALEAFKSEVAAAAATGDIGGRLVKKDSLEDNTGHIGHHIWLDRNRIITPFGKLALNT